MRVHVEGLRELERALAELPKATGKAVLRRVAKAALEPVDKDWRARAPVKEGHLNTSGGVGTKLTRRQAKLARKETKSSIEMYAGPNDPAAIQDEFGNVHQAAQPFLRPAWDANKAGVLDHVAGELGNEIERAATRLAKKRAKAG